MTELLDKIFVESGLSEAAAFYIWTQAAESIAEKVLLGFLILAACAAIFFLAKKLKL